MKIILGSASKGRREVLERMGYDFEIMTAGIDEKAIRDTDPKKLTLRLAHAKADALLSKIFEPALLITSDQVVYWNGNIHEKPESPERARENLKNYVAHPVETVTAVVVTNTLTKQRLEGIDVAKVVFSPIPDDVIQKTIDEGDVFTRAGGFNIEDPLLQGFIQKIEGEKESIIGLPKTLTEALLQKASNV